MENNSNNNDVTKIFKFWKIQNINKNKLYKI